MTLEDFSTKAQQPKIDNAVFITEYLQPKTEPTKDLAPHVHLAWDIFSPFSPTNPNSLVNPNNPANPNSPFSPFSPLNSANRHSRPNSEHQRQQREDDVLQREYYDEY